MHPATGQDVGAFGCFQQGNRFADPPFVRLAAFYAPDFLAEEIRRAIKGDALYILRQGDGRRAGIHRIGHDAHRFRRRIQDLLGAGDAVEELADDAKAIGDAHIQRNRMFDILQDLPLKASGVIIGGQQQNGQAIDMGGGGARDHVGRARADRGGAGESLRAQAGPRESGRRMHHRLLIRRLIIRQLIAIFPKRLAQSAHIAVAEDAPNRGNEALQLAVVLGVLHLQEFDQGLPHRQPHRFLAAKSLKHQSALLICPVYFLVGAEPGLVISNLRRLVICAASPVY